jgi:hypothetical protein
MTKEAAIDILESQKNEHYKEEINEALDMAISALKGFEGMTNGEVFETIYPDHEAEKVGLNMVLRPKGKKGIGDTHILVDLDFWNAPYQKGE